MSAPCTGAPCTAAADRTVAVVGAGFSGTMVALHLAEALPPGQRVLLCDRENFACGPAYATRNEGHLLNVRAANMSAFPDRPAHFETWLRTAQWDGGGKVTDTDVGLFASRGLYRRYLCSLLDEAIGAAPGRLTSLRAEVVDISRDAGGWILQTVDGAQHGARAVVLAIGNLPPVALEDRLYKPNPWAAGIADGLRDDLPVLIVGTGLTMVDLALQLHDSGFGGPVIALSRRGLLPQRHAPTRPWPTPDLSEAERSSLALLLARVRWDVRRAAARGVDWRGVIDSLRPITADIWRSLSEADRTQFLRHLRPYWDVHRHRLAPPVAERIDALRASGFLQVRRGRAGVMQFGDDQVSVQIRAAGSKFERLEVQRVLSATGLQSAADGDSKLVRALRRRGLARLDPWSFGLDVTDDLQVRDAAGRPTPTLRALGPIVRGVFWECIAVPDLRVQARRVANEILALTPPAAPSVRQVAPVG